MRRLVAVGVVFVLMAGCSSGDDTIDGSTDTDPTGPVQVPLSLDAADPLDRYAAAYELIGDPDVKTGDLVEQLGAALVGELAAPSEGSSESWFTFSESLARAYTTGLGSPGADAIPDLRRLLDNTDGPARAWVVLALGYAGDESAAPDLAELLDSSPAVQVQAIDLLGQFGYTEVIPELRALLDDPLSVENPHLPDADPRYPVRDEAAAALRKLGLTVYTDPATPGTYQVIEP